MDIVPPNLMVRYPWLAAGKQSERATPAGSAATAETAKFIQKQGKSGPVAAGVEKPAKGKQSKGKAVQAANSDAGPVQSPGPSAVPLESPSASPAANGDAPAASGQRQPTANGVSEPEAKSSKKNKAAKSAKASPAGELSSCHHGQAPEYGPQVSVSQMHADARQCHRVFNRKPSCTRCTIGLFGTMLKALLVLYRYLCFDLLQPCAHTCTVMDSLALAVCDWACKRPAIPDIAEVEHAQAH